MRTITKFLVIASAAAFAASVIPTAGASSKPAVKATLFEFKIKTKPKTVAAGKIKLAAKNIGAEKHELVVVRTADVPGGAPASLPTKADGSVDESAIPEADKLGEIPEFKPKTTKTKTFDLDPGSYILFCNVVDKESDGSTLSHFAQGMYTTLVVT